MSGKILKTMRRLKDAVPNRIMLAVALRGTAGTAIPFLALRLLGHPGWALFATIAGLNTNIADSGGSYRRRLRAMGLTALIMPLIIFIGTQVRHIWWLSTLVMFLVALVGGMSRTLGPTGMSLGMIAGLVYLIGMEVPGTVVESARNAGFYYVGASWTILLTLVVWRLRPYKRIKLELAECFSKTAGLIAATQPFCDQSFKPADDYEAKLVQRQQGVREMLEQSGENIGRLLDATEGVDPAINQLMILVRASSRISVAALSLAENMSSCAIAMQAENLGEMAEKVTWQLEKLCRRVGTALVDGNMEFNFENADQLLNALEESVRQRRRAATRDAVNPAELEGLLIAFNQIRRYLKNAKEALEGLSGHKSNISGILPPLNRVESGNGSLERLKANLTLHSVIFRHALRVAAATAGGTALFTLLELPHGIWIPLTTLLVLQPNFGATLQRAFYRAGGTMAGAILAGLAVFILHKSAAYEVIIILCLFGTFLFFRRHYGVAVIFITTLIILLLDLVAFSPWTTIADRVLDTLAGAALGLVAGYVLWPRWERHTLPEQLAAAIRANRHYLHEVFTTLYSATDGSVMESQRRAELEVNNADAAFQRMLGDPKRHRGHAELTVSVVTHLRRLNRHLTSFAVHLGEHPEALPGLTEMEKRLTAVLDESAGAIENQRPAHEVPSIDEAYERVHTKLRGGQSANFSAEEDELDMPQSRIAGIRVTLDFLLDRIIGDVNSLYAASSSTAAAAPRPA